MLQRQVTLVQKNGEIMNYLTLAGHLGADPETRYTPSGKKVTTLRLACRSRKGGKDSTIWWKVTIWEEQFDRMMPYLKKGSPLMVMGEMQDPELYQDRNGNTQVSLQMVAHNLSFSPFGQSKNNNANAGATEQSASPEMAAAPAAETATGQGSDVGFSDDEVPF